jgi:molybdenum cofactor cytidylyltransferase
MRLADALRVDKSMTVAFVGAGGKSSAIHQLIVELNETFPVIVTTTTKLGTTQGDMAGPHLELDGNPNFAQIRRLLQDSNSGLVTNGQTLNGKKLIGLDDTQVGILHEIAKELGAVLLIEADGARGKSLKAPADHEPVIPNWVDEVVVTAGLDVIGKAFTSEHIHRIEIAKTLLGIEGKLTIDVNVVARLLESGRAGLKDVPSKATARALLTHAESNENLALGRQIAYQLLRSSRYQSISLGTQSHSHPVVESHARIAGIILAAGASSRLEGPKQMIPFKGKPLFEYALNAAIDGGLSPVVVVTGEHGDLIEAQVDLPQIEFVHNPHPEQGQSGSLILGLEQIGKEIEGVIFLLADMPLVNGELVTALRKKHAETLAPVVVPYTEGKRGNPVLFDRVTFDALRGLMGDQGGRGVFHQFRLEKLVWDSSIQVDIDTPDDLKRLRDLE